MRFLFLAFGLACSMSADSFSLSNYQLVSSQRVSVTKISATYSAVLISSGVAASSVSATASSLSNAVQVVAGKDTLNFSPVPANGQVSSTNTFSITVDRSVPFDFSQLQWKFQSTSNTGVPASILAVSDTSQVTTPGSAFPAPFVVKVTDGLSNPVSGVAVTFMAPTGGVSGTFAGGASTISVLTDSFGFATSPVFSADRVQGSYNVTATVKGLDANANFYLTNAGGPPRISPVTVGKDLETSTSVLLGVTAPAAGLAVTITSGDPSKVLLSKSSDTVGSGVLMLTVLAGLSYTPDFYVQGLASSGVVTLTIAAANLFGNDGYVVPVVTLTPAGFVIAGPYGVGVGSFLTATGKSADQITVYSVQLDPSTGNVVSPQQVRGGLSTTINVTSSNPTVGTITASPVTISSGNFSAVTSFQPLQGGVSVLSVDVPTGFSLPAQDTTVSAIVKPGCSVPILQETIGLNLQAQEALVLCSTAPAGGLPVTLTSNSPNLLLSKSAITPGTSSIVVTVPAGANDASFFIQGFASTGTATYTLNAAGFALGSGTVTFGPSGVVLAGPFGLGFPFAYPTTTKSAPSSLAVSTALLDITGQYLATQQLAAGFLLNVSLTSNAPDVGTVNPVVSIFGGTDSASAQFTPLAAGKATVTVITPNGYQTPSALFSTVQFSIP